MKSLFILLFFTGVLPHIPAIPRRYYLIQQGKTWYDARAYCQSMYTDLAIIDSDDNMVRFKNETQKQQFSSSAWIGLYNNFSDCHWSFNDTPLGSWRPWESGQPNNAGGQQECGVIAPTGWVDSACSASFPFLCFDAGQTGTSRFIYYSTPMTWLNAQAECRRLHTDLATVTDSTENTIVMGMITDLMFFGLYRFPWRWVDKTKLSNFLWAPGQPDNKAGNEYCAYLSNGNLSDTQCSTVLPFFCYSDKYPDVKKTQTMSVKVQSDQNLTDVEETVILEMIQQKLKDMKVANVTVKFRKHPNGTVFRKLP